MQLVMAGKSLAVDKMTLIDKKALLYLSRTSALSQCPVSCCQSLRRSFMEAWTLSVKPKGTMGRPIRFPQELIHLGLRVHLVGCHKESQMQRQDNLHSQRLG